MTTEHDEPKRLFDVGEDDELRAALRDARGELPNEARLEAIFMRLPSGSGGGGGGGDAPPPPTVAPKFGVAGAALGVVGVAILGGAIYLGVRANAPKDRPAPTTTVAGATVTGAVSERVASAVPPSESASSATTVTARSVGDPPRTPPSVSAPPSASSPARSEIEILREAQSNASSSPGRAIALCDEHARLYPSGALSEEREFIRIQALMAAGRVGEARALADAFEARHPGSAHAVRLEEIVGRAKPAPSTTP